MNSVEMVLNILKERNIPVSRLERECGFSNGYLKQLKKGSIPAGRLMQIANYLSVDFKSLLPMPDEPDSEKKTAAQMGDGLSDDQLELISIIRDLDPASVRYLSKIAREVTEYRRFLDGQEHTE